MGNMAYIFGRTEEETNTLSALYTEKCSGTLSMEWYTINTRYPFSYYSQFINHWNMPFIIIPTIEILGNTEFDIFIELSKIRDNSSRLIICDYPSTVCFDNVEHNKAVLSLLCDIYQKKVKQATDKPVKSGRKKIDFPSMWEAYYTRWKNGQITANMFMYQTNLKRTTFYSLVKEYEAMLKERENIDYATGHQKDL